MQWAQESAQQGQLITLSWAAQNLCHSLPNRFQAVITKKQRVILTIADLSTNLFARLDKHFLFL